MWQDAESWRATLIAISAVNGLAWLLAGLALMRRRRRVAKGNEGLGSPDREGTAGAARTGDGNDSIHGAGAHRLRCGLLLLSAVYVLGCAYRSWWPVFDIPRIVMVDSWMSSVIVGRSVATVAELCFVVQFAWLLRALGRAVQVPVAVALSRWLVPMAMVAEACSWMAVLTTSNLGHAVEESLWGLGALLWTAGVLATWRRWPAGQRWLPGACIAIGLAYAGYMFGIDVPMYWARWLADEAAARPYLDLAEGVRDAASRWTVSTHWPVWRGEAAWMTMYFSAAVWLSIAAVHMPLPAPRPVRG